MSCYFDYFDDECEGKVIRHIHNGELSVNVIRKENGDVYSDENDYIGNINDEDINDKIDEFEETWKETNWSNEDWADWYGCDVDQLEDCMDDDIKDLY